MSLIPEASIEIGDASDSLKTKANHLLETFENGLEKIRKNRNSNKRKAVFLKVTNIFLTGSAMLILGLKFSGYEAIQKELAFAFASLATIANAIEPFFTFRALWVQHEIAQWNLHRLIDKFKFYVTGLNDDKIDINVIEEYQKEYIAIWDELSKIWIEHRKRSEY